MKIMKDKYFPLNFGQLYESTLRPPLHQMEVSNYGLAAYKTIDSYTITKWWNGTIYVEFCDSNQKDALMRKHGMCISPYTKVYTEHSINGIVKFVSFSKEELIKEVKQHISSDKYKTDTELAALRVRKRCLDKSLKELDAYEENC